MNPFSAARERKNNGLKAKQNPFAAARALRNQAPEQGFIPGVVDSITQGMSFGFGDEISAAEAALLGRQDGGWFDYGDTSFSDRYNQALQTERAQQQRFGQENPVIDTVAEIGGGLTTGVGLARSGLTLANAGSTLPARLGYGAAEGLGYGAVAGAGYGDDDRAGGAIQGAFLGGVIGAAAPAIIAGGQAGARSLGGMVGLGNQGRANQALGTMLERSGKSLDDVRGELSAARADGQDVYTVADALDKTGRRALSAVVRTPNDAREEVAEALMRRQAGQADRIVNTLAEGFDARTTRQIAEDSLTKARRSTATELYGAARDQAGAVNVNAAVQAIDDRVSPGIHQITDPGTTLAPESIERTLMGFRQRLANNSEQLTDYQSVFNLKRDVDDAIERATRAGEGGKVEALMPVRRELDNALSQASDPYAQARDTYRTMSRELEGFGLGSRAAKGTNRPADNIATFRGLEPYQQQPFRTGYADDLMRSVENRAGPMTDRSRQFTSSKFTQEFPEFAAPGQADTLTNRLSREQKMHQTMAEALGGSRTADNLADQTDLQLFDPTVIGNAMAGNFGLAASNALRQGAAALQGRNDTTTQMIARALMETDPEAFYRVFSPAIRRARALSATEAGITRGLAAQGGGAIVQ